MAALLSLWEYMGWKDLKIGNETYAEMFRLKNISELVKL